MQSSASQLLGSIPHPTTEFEKNRSSRPDTHSHGLGIYILFNGIVTYQVRIVLGSSLV